MQLMWHGRNGRGGNDHSIFTIGIASDLPFRPGDPRSPIAADHAAKPAQAGRRIKLIPGVNDLPGEFNKDFQASDWETAKKNPAIQGYLNGGQLEVIHAETLAGFQVPQAKGLAEETIDLNILRRWKQAEHRPEVVKAIDGQLAKLLAPVPADPYAAGAEKKK